jgi:hypothetical protein
MFNEHCLDCFSKGVREEFEGIWRENLPSKPLNFNSLKLEEFGRRGEERRGEESGSTVPLPHIF